MTALWPDVVPATADGMVRRRRRVRVYGPTAIQLDAGESRRYAVRIAPRRWHRRWRPFGRRRSYPFRLVARPNTSELALRPVAGSDEGIAKILGLVRDDHSSVAARAFVGELVHRPLPYWVLFLATLLLALATYLRFPQIPQTVADHIEQRRTFTVGYGPITQTITLEGIVMPAEAQRLAFGVNGRVSEVTVPEGGEVRTGRFISTGGPCESEPVNWIAVLEEEEALRQGCFTALRGLEKAESDLEQAQRQQERDQAQATQDLELAKQDLQRLSSGGEQDLYAAAEKNLIASARALTDTISTASAAKTEAENRMLNALNAQHEAEQRYSQAVWENQRVQETGRHPTEKEPNSQGGVETKYRKLNDLEKQQFRDAVVLAAQVLSDTQRLLQDATLAYDLARQQEVTLVQGAEARVAEAQKGVEALASGDNKDLNAARARADTAQRALDAIVERSLADQEKAIADAESLLKQAEQRWKESYLSPPSDGRVVALTIKPGDQAQAGTPVALIALTPLQFEVRAELSADQLQGLFTDQLSTVSVSLPSPSATAAFSVTARPISLAPAADLNVAAPGQTQSVIFSLDLPDDYDRQPLLENKPVKITVVRRLTSDDVCWVAPEAINVSPQGAYVMVRRGALDYRVPVRAGVRTDTQVAIQNIDPVPTATGDSAATAVPTPAIALPAPAPTPPPFCGQVQDLERQPEAGLGAWYTNLIRGQPTRQHELIVGP
ncbi:MAG: HlyD family efflux transporter periplasmic adaptor subunit [Chloroflexales bacterium]|nr:HlyD family efflux transporter periplasmic adaptor subunit [Chloroflexales bacterium]